MTCDFPVGGEGVWFPDDDAGGSDRAEKPVLPTHGAHVGKCALLTQVIAPYSSILSKGKLAHQLTACFLELTSYHIRSYRVLNRFFHS